MAGGYFLAFSIDAKMQYQKISFVASPRYIFNEYFQVRLQGAHKSYRMLRRLDVY